LAWSGGLREARAGGACSDFIDGYEAGARLEVTLPWLLAQFAHAVQRVVGQRGQGLLEKK